MLPMNKRLSLALLCCLLPCSGCAATGGYLLNSLLDNTLGSTDDTLPKPLTDRMSKSDARRANFEYSNASRVEAY